MAPSPATRELLVDGHRAVVPVVDEESAIQAVKAFTQFGVADAPDPINDAEAAAALAARRTKRPFYTATRVDERTFRIVLVDEATGQEAASGLVSTDFDSDEEDGPDTDVTPAALAAPATAKSPPAAPNFPPPSNSSASGVDNPDVAPAVLGVPAAAPALAAALMGSPAAISAQSPAAASAASRGSQDLSTREAVSEHFDGGILPRDPPLTSGTATMSDQHKGQPLAHEPTVGGKQDFVPGQEGTPTAEEKISHPVSEKKAFASADDQVAAPITAVDAPDSESDVKAAVPDSEKATPGDQAAVASPSAALAAPTSSTEPSSKGPGLSVPAATAGAAAVAAPAAALSTKSSPKPTPSTQKDVPKPVAVKSLTRAEKKAEKKKAKENEKARKAEAEQTAKAKKIEAEKAAKARKLEAEKAAKAKKLEADKAKREQAEKAKRDQIEKVQREQAEKDRKVEAQKAKKAEADKVKRESAAKAKRDKAETAKRLEAEKAGKAETEKTKKLEAEKTKKLEVSKGQNTETKKNLNAPLAAVKETHPAEAEKSRGLETDATQSVDVDKDKQVQADRAKDRASNFATANAQRIDQPEGDMFETLGVEKPEVLLAQKPSAPQPATAKTLDLKEPRSPEVEKPEGLTGGTSETPEADKHKVSVSEALSEPNPDKTKVLATEKSKTSKVEMPKALTVEKLKSDEVAKTQTPAQRQKSQQREVGEAKPTEVEDVKTVGVEDIGALKPHAAQGDPENSKKAETEGARPSEPRNIEGANAQSNKAPDLAVDKAERLKAETAKKPQYEKASKAGTDKAKAKSAKKSGFFRSLFSSRKPPSKAAVTAPPSKAAAGGKAATAAAAAVALGTSAGVSASDKVRSSTGESKATTDQSRIEPGAKGAALAAAARAPASGAAAITDQGKGEHQEAVAMPRDEPKSERKDVSTQAEDSQQEAATKNVKEDQHTEGTATSVNETFQAGQEALISARGDAAVPDEKGVALTNDATIVSNSAAAPIEQDPSVAKDTAPSEASDIQKASAKKDVPQQTETVPSKEAVSPVEGMAAPITKQTSPAKAGAGQVETVVTPVEAAAPVETPVQERSSSLQRAISPVADAAASRDDRSAKMDDLAPADENVPASKPAIDPVEQVVPVQQTDFAPADAIVSAKETAASLEARVPIADEAATSDQNAAVEQKAVVSVQDAPAEKGPIDPALDNVDTSPEALPGDAKGLTPAAKTSPSGKRFKVVKIIPEPDASRGRTLRLTSDPEDDTAHVKAETLHSTDEPRTFVGLDEAALKAKRESTSGSQSEAPAANAVAASNGANLSPARPHLSALLSDQPTVSTSSIYRGVEGPGGQVALEHASDTPKKEASSFVSGSVNDEKTSASVDPPPKVDEDAREPVAEAAEDEDVAEPLAETATKSVADPASESAIQGSISDNPVEAVAEPELSAPKTDIPATKPNLIAAESPAGRTAHAVESSAETSGENAVKELDGPHFAPPVTPAAAFTSADDPEPKKILAPAVAATGAFAVVDEVVPEDETSGEAKGAKSAQKTESEKAHTSKAARLLQPLSTATAVHPAEKKEAKPAISEGGKTAEKDAKQTRFSWFRRAKKAEVVATPATASEIKKPTDTSKSAAAPVEVVAESEKMPSQPLARTSSAADDAVEENVTQDKAFKAAEATESATRSGLRKDATVKAAEPEAAHVTESATEGECGTRLGADAVKPTSPAKNGVTRSHVEESTPAKAVAEAAESDEPLKTPSEEGNVRAGADALVDRDSSAEEVDSDEQAVDTPASGSARTPAVASRLREDLSSFEPNETSATPASGIVGTAGTATGAAAGAALGHGKPEKAAKNRLTLLRRLADRDERSQQKKEEKRAEAAAKAAVSQRTALSTSAEAQRAQTAADAKRAEEDRKTAAKASQRREKEARLEEKRQRAEAHKQHRLQRKNAERVATEQAALDLRAWQANQDVLAHERLAAVKAQRAALDEQFTPERAAEAATNPAAQYNVWRQEHPPPLPQTSYTRRAPRASTDAHPARSVKSAHSRTKRVHSAKPDTPLSREYLAPHGVAPGVVMDPLPRSVKSGRSARSVVSDESEVSVINPARGRGIPAPAVQWRNPSAW